MTTRGEAKLDLVPDAGSWGWVGVDEIVSAIRGRRKKEK